jgi:hypothetical protein
MMPWRVLVIGVIWAASLFGAGLWAQSGQWQPVPMNRMGQPLGDVISGDDIGIQRIASPPDREGRITGRLMVRVDGKWREVVFPAGVVLTGK